MAHYLVRARVKPERVEELRDKLDARAFDEIKPFGRGLTNALWDARRDPTTGEAVWEEQCFCRPPLAAERAAVLDHFFDAIVTEEVQAGEGWHRIETLPKYWEDAS